MLTKRNHPAIDQKLTATLALVSIIGTTLLLACTGGQVSKRPNRAKNIITFGCFSHQSDVYGALIAEFEQSHPNIGIQLVQVDKLYQEMGASDMTFLLRALAEAADTFPWFNLELDQAAWLDLLLDIKPFMKEAQLETDFVPGLLEGLADPDSLRILPAGFDLPLLYYSRNIFDATGLSYPDPDWQWEHLLTAARALTVHQGDETVRYGFADLSGSILLALAYQHGAKLAYLKEGLLQPRLDDPAMAEALAWYVSLANEYRVMPEPGRFDGNQLRAMADSDHIAMWTSFSAMYRQHDPLKVGVAPLPHDAATAHPILVQGYAISNGTRYPQAAWQWIEFLSRSITPLRSETPIPARTSVIETQNYWETVEDMTAQAIHYALNYALPSTEAWQFQTFVRDLTPVFRGEITPEDFLIQSQTKALTWQSQRVTEKPRPFAVSTPVIAKSKETIVFGLSSGFYQETYQQMAQEFMRQHPDIVIEVKNIANDRKWVDASVMRENSDVFLFEMPVTGTLDLDPFIQADESFNLNDILPQAMNAVRDGGHIWGLAIAADVRGIFFNKDLFDQYGVTYPSPGWTWDDFLEKAVLLTQGEDHDKQYGFLSYFPAQDLQLYIEGRCQIIADIQARPPVYNFDSPAVKNALRWWVSLYHEYGVMPVPQFGFSGDLGYNLLSKRRVAMWTNWVSQYDARWLYGPGDEPRLGVVPFPVSDCSVADVQFHFGYISSATEKAQQCWIWLKYLSQRLPAGHLAPVRQSLLADIFRQQTGEEATNVYMHTLQADTYLNLDRNGMPWINKAMNAIAEGMDVDEALNEAQSKAEASLKEPGP